MRARLALPRLAALLSVFIITCPGRESDRQTDWQLILDTHTGEGGGGSGFHLGGNRPTADVAQRILKCFILSE